MKIIGWGKWGKTVCDILSMLDLPSSCPRTVLSGGDFDLATAPDPVVADWFFGEMPPQMVNAVIDPEESCHLHVLHGGEIFSAGGVSGLMRRLASAGKKTHMAIVLLPPRGSNSEVVGRLLTNIVGLKKFFDICVLLDASTTPFIDRDSQYMAAYAAGLCSLFLSFEKSACMFPLLTNMDSRFLAFSGTNAEAILQEGSLGPLWQGLSLRMGGKVEYNQQASRFLAFSVSAKAERNLDQIFRRDIPPGRHTYIPFLRFHDWQDAVCPTEVCALPMDRGAAPGMGAEIMASFMNIFSARRKRDFVGIFAADLPARSLLDFLKSYWNTYWPEERRSEKYEALAPEVRDWFKAHGTDSPILHQHQYLVRSARDFLKQIIGTRRNTI